MRFAKVFIDTIALQGNLDPAVLTTTPKITRLEARRILDENSSQWGLSLI